MTKLQQARDSYNQAFELRQNGATFVLGFRNRFYEENAKISRNKGLNEEGRQIVKDEIRGVIGMEFMQAVHKRRSEYLGYLRSAVTAAESFINSAVKKPKAEKVAKFEADLRELKTELLLSPNAGRGLAKLSEFAGKLDDPYLAGVFREEYGTLASSIIGAPGSDSEVRAQLSTLFQRLKTSHDTDEVSEAREILEAAKASEANPSLFNVHSLGTTVQEMFGQEYQRHLNSSHEFFAKEAYVSFNPDSQSRQSRHEQSMRASNLGYALRIQIGE
ncbi:hypothetical protein ACFSR7_23620 [Cohnella sp. GCM10020058]|uniref:hypothetical protein n=1 Tax=Cohnella sp. GCM10020058 TaxID=3317330 RepID=UPI00362585CF